MANGEALVQGLLPAGERYEVLKTLGQGAYGVVALARDKESNEKACADALLNPLACGSSCPQLQRHLREAETGCVAVCDKVY